MIAIIDYGAGNLQSVVNAMHYIGADVEIIRSPEELERADGAILPGVGSFGEAMNCLRGSRLVDPILSFVRTGKPFLGICIGLQMLFDESEESPGVAGLGVFRGKIHKIPAAPGRKVPHMGWNALKFQGHSPLFHGIPDISYFYFVHSYYLHSNDRSIVAGQTQYGLDIDAAISINNVFATQFHPEKSGETGIQMLRNFVNLVEG